ncbi:hypothetical protein D9756_008427 [Leucocoprinus leucothites]|uniref:Cell morphogenesis protein n=1 Tax=Leucocoprinus leucothites TaxID=201217 RepID=A0A8H5D048_9AGAR|nr:hypothetical protein D9756_008427 [Leucoagaricus leucothites]
MYPLAKPKIEPFRGTSGQVLYGSPPCAAMNEGIQITIPDFDDGSAGSTTTPFGRSGGGFGFGGGFGGAGSGWDSPTVSTPLGGFGERSFFSHSRGDSSASIDSASSNTTKGFTTKRSTTFGHSTQPSVSTTSSAFTKKPSFASIRNAFKSSAKNNNNDPPPVPQLDTSYPVLKNPFNRSTSSLNHVQPLSAKGSVSVFQRPPTPGSNETRFGRGRSKTHGYAKSQHSHSGSMFHGVSEFGFDLSHGMPASPPPMPPLPFGQFSRSDTPPTDLEEEKVVMDPKTPSEFALHAVFIRFVALAERKIENFLRVPLVCFIPLPHLSLQLNNDRVKQDQNPLLPDYMGPGVDTKFDEILRSLGQIAQKHAKQVIDSIMRWRRSQNESVSADITRTHSTESPSSSRNRPYDAPSILNERKSMASIYIMCRALIGVLSSISKDALGETLGYNLEETTFEQFRRPDMRLLIQSVNHRTNAELYATLLGHIANIRFMSVTDRFLAELGPVATGQIPKDADVKYENLVKALRHIKIKVWPYEAFEEGAEFMEPLAKAFANAHGLRLKTTFAETLVHILHPISKTAQAETNNPQWAKAIEIIFPKAREMMAKPRYWQAAFPLTITSLCVAPQAFFLKHWVSCFEASIAKLKEKPTRVMVMNGILRLIWTYLYRCQESASTTATKLDTLLKHFFHAKQLSAFHPDDRFEFLTYVVHFILSRHFDTGRELSLELLQESTINAMHRGGGTGTLSPDKITIAVQATLLSLHLMEKENGVPAWPSTHDFSIVPPKADYPSSSTVLPSALASKTVIQEYVNRVGTTLGHIVTLCDNTVGHMSVLEDQYSYSRVNPSFEESSNYIVRKHSDSYVTAYPAQFASQVNLLQTCFSAWPRCLHSSIPLGDAVEMLLRGVLHVEPSLSEVAVEAVKRIIEDPMNGMTVIRHFTAFVFSPVRILRASGSQLLVECVRLLMLWKTTVEKWKAHLVQMDVEGLVEQFEDVRKQCYEVEAASLFLLAHGAMGIRVVGVEIIRLLGSLVEEVEKLDVDVQLTLAITDRLLNGIDHPYLEGYDDLLEQPELDRLKQRKNARKPDVMLELASSSNDFDKKLWRYVFPTFMQTCMDEGDSSLPLFRDALAAAALRFHPQISQLAGLSNSRLGSRGGQAAGAITEKDGLRMIRESKGLIDQWHIWMKIICSTSVLPEANPSGVPAQPTPAHVSADPQVELRKYPNSRYLFKRLTPFLDSEYTLFRDIAVLCISSFPSNVYPQLLEDLKSLAGRQTDYDPRVKVSAGIAIPVVDGNIGLLGSRQMIEDTRAKTGAAGFASMERSRRQERLHSAVARIYFLTAHLLQSQRSTGRQTSLMNILTFIRSTQGFLSTPEMRENHSLQRLRRYFCGTIERVFDALTSIKDSDRFVAANMHLTLYRLCEEWCQFGAQSDAAAKRLKSMQKVAAASGSPHMDAADATERFQAETTLLSHAAVGALASLCAKALFPPEYSANSPTERGDERLSPEMLKPLSGPAVLDRLKAICTSAHVPSQVRGRKALKSILSSPQITFEVAAALMTRAVVLVNEANSSSRQFFEVVADAVSSGETGSLSFSQVVCLGFSNLRHPEPEIRNRAFQMLEAIHQQSQGLLTMSNFEATAAGSASCAYIHAHRAISDFLAGEHPGQAMNMLKQVGEWLPSLPATPATSNVILLLLQSLEFWLPHIVLMTEDKTSLSSEGVNCLYYLTLLTLRYNQSHPEQILVMWAKLVDSSHPSNGHAAIRFLLEQANKVGNTKFISCATNIVTGLCQTRVGRQIFEDLCSVIEPARMLPTIDHKLHFPNEEDINLWSNLNDLFSDEPRLVLGSAQYAWLFLSDITLQRSWDYKAQLPVLLHSLFTHIDHRNEFVRQRARSMLLQILRAWTPGYSELADRSIARARPSVKEAITQLIDEMEEHCWTEEDPPEVCQDKMKWLCSRAIGFLEPLHSQIASHWGTLALLWGTSCSIRSVAFRSLQLFRALMPRIKQGDFALLLGRLTNTIAAADDNIQSFTSEILLTVIAIAKVGDLDRTVLPQLFWCTCACLSTTVEKEFLQVLALLDAVLARINLDDPSTSELLLSHRPIDWEGQPFIQQLLLKGLRSSVTSEATMKILQILARIQDDRLIDASGGRVRDLYTVSLPWCLNAMVNDRRDSTLVAFAENISYLANQEGRQSIARIMSSFSKGAFRTKDDFMRQSISSLREHYGSHYWTEIVTLLLGLVLNSEDWLRIQAMQIVKILFQQRETWNPVELLGSELLMPLLRLLETDLASQALDVLEEPMVMSSGTPAKHVLRMSMHGRLSQRVPETVTTTVFGVPEESGWCVAQIDTLRDACRANVMAVFDTCSMPTRPSQIIFEPELEAITSMGPAGGSEDLGGLVKNLHDLTSYFQDGGGSSNNQIPPLPSRKLEARVAAILAKSSAADAINDVPQTPFLDVFEVRHSGDTTESDHETDSDTDEDAFVFDSPTTYPDERIAINGSRFR